MGKKFGQAQANMRLHHRKPMSNWLQPKCKICEAIIVFPLDQAALVQRKACLTYILQPPFMVDSPIFCWGVHGCKNSMSYFQLAPFPRVWWAWRRQAERRVVHHPFSRAKGFKTPTLFQGVSLLQGFLYTFKGLPFARLGYPFPRVGTCPFASAGSSTTFHTKPKALKQNSCRGMHAR